MIEDYDFDTPVQMSPFLKAAKNVMWDIENGPDATLILQSMWGFQATCGENTKHQNGAQMNVTTWIVMEEILKL